MAKLEIEVPIPEIYIHPKAREMIDNFTKLSPGEMSLLGTVKEQKNDKGEIKFLIIDEVFFPEQKNSSGFTEMEDSAVAELIVELANRGDGSEERLKVWIHSHANFGVFWSGTDDATIASFAGNTYLVSIVVNKKGDVLTRLDIFNAFNINNPLMSSGKALTFNKLTLHDQPIDYGTWEECEKLYQKNATYNAYTGTSANAQYPTRWNSGAREYLGSYGSGTHGTSTSGAKGTETKGSKDTDYRRDPAAWGRDFAHLDRIYDETWGWETYEDRRSAKSTDTDADADAEAVSSEEAVFLADTRGLSTKHDEDFEPYNFVDSLSQDELDVMDLSDVETCWAAFQFYIIGEGRYVKAMKALRNGDPLNTVLTDEEIEQAEAVLYQETQDDALDADEDTNAVEEETQQSLEDTHLFLEEKRQISKKFKRYLPDALLSEHSKDTLDALDLAIVWAAYQSYFISEEDYVASVKSLIRGAKVDALLSVKDVWRALTRIYSTVDAQNDAFAKCYNQTKQSRHRNDATETAPVETNSEKLPTTQKH